MASSVMLPARRLARKQQGDGDNQQRAVAQRAGQVAERHLDEVGLPEQPCVEPHARRQLSLELIQRAVQRARQRQRVRVGLAVDSQQYRRQAVVGSIATLDRLTDTELGDVLHPDGEGVASSDHRRGDRLDIQGAAGAPDQVLAAAGLPEAGRGIAAGAPQRFLEGAQWHTVARQAPRVGEHLELAALAADHRDLRDAGHGQQPPPDDDIRGGAQFEGSWSCRFRCRIGVRGRLQRDEHDLAHDRRGRRQDRRTDVIG